MFIATLIIATLLCSLVAGLLFTFKIIVMPGIHKLNDRDFIRAFQEMDGIIQKNHPLFILVWVGSIIALLLALILGFGQLGFIEQVLMILSALFYLIGVQILTIKNNIPLNNKLQSVDTNNLDEAKLKRAREEFEPIWNKWNSIRTVFSSLTVILLIILLYMN